MKSGQWSTYYFVLVDVMIRHKSGWYFLFLGSFYSLCNHWSYLHQNRGQQKNLYSTSDFVYAGHIAWRIFWPLVSEVANRLYPMKPMKNCFNSQGFDTQLAVRMYVNTGIVTGGEYDQQSVACMPYGAYNYVFDYATGVGTSYSCPASCPNTAYGIKLDADRSKGLKITLGYKTSTVRQIGQFLLWPESFPPPSRHKDQPGL